MVEIRLAVRDDASEIASLLTAAFAEFKPLYTDEAFAATTPPRDQIAIRISEGPVWVALHGSRILGSVSAVSRSESLYIRGMAVLPAERGKKVGQLLLAEVAQYALEHGFKRMTLSTTPFLDRAIHLYQQFGFRRTTEGPDDLFGTPLFTMVKKVGQSIMNGSCNDLSSE